MPTARRGRRLWSATLCRPWEFALHELLGAQPGCLAVIGTRCVVSGAAGRHDDCPAAVSDELALGVEVVISSAVSWSPASGAAMKRSTHTTAASSWRACAADSSAISRALPPVTQPPQEKPTMVATRADPARAQNSTALLARYCWKRRDSVWFSILLHGNLSGLVCLAPRQTDVLGRSDTSGRCRRRLAERRIRSSPSRSMRQAPAAVLASYS